MVKIAGPRQPGVEGATDRPGRAGFGLIAGVVLGLVAFIPALFHYFTGEDFVFIKAAADNVPFYEPTQRLFYRPLPNLLWQADYTLWGLNPAGYHLTNLLLHLFNALLAGLLAQKLTGRREVGWLATTLFALHPAHIEAVDWLASRPDLLATAFCLLSALSGLDFFTNEASKRREWLYPLSVLAFGAGLFSKEAAAGLPFALFGLGLIYRRGRGWKSLLWRLWPYLVVGGLYGLARYNALGGIGGYNSEGRDLFYIAWNLTGGLWLPLLFPLNLESAGPVGSVVLLSLLLVLYAGLVWNFFLRRHIPFGPKKPWLAGLVFMYGCLLPALNTAPVDTNLAQSRILYLPSVGFCVVISYQLSVISNGFKVQSSRFKVSSSFILHPSSFLLMGLLAWQVGALQVNLAPWQQAGEMVRQTFSQLGPYRFPFVDGDTLYFEGVPDSYRGAYGWRNGLEPAASLLTGQKVGGFNHTPDLKVDYRRAERGKVWFLRYNYDEAHAGLSLQAVYNLGNPTGITGKALASWNFSGCDSLGWDWKPGAGQMVCQPEKGLQFDTRGQKTGLTGRSPAFGLPATGPLYLEFTTYVDYDFEQPQVLAEAYLQDGQSGQDLAGYPFDLAANGRAHTYRLYFLSPRLTNSAVITLKANKLRSNILWQRISIGN